MTAQTIYDIRDRYADFDGKVMHALFEMLTDDPSPAGRTPIRHADLVALASEHPETEVGDAARAVLARLGR